MPFLRDVKVIILKTPSTSVLDVMQVENGKVLFKVADVKTWSPDSPYLYGLKVTVEHDGKVVIQLTDILQ